MLLGISSSNSEVFITLLPLVKFTVVPDIPDESMCDEERGSLDRLIRSFVKGGIQIADINSGYTGMMGSRESGVGSRGMWNYGP